MGKWVVCAKHPSNEFFEQFPNCLTYRNEEEFAANVYWALHHEPLVSRATARARVKGMAGVAGQIVLKQRPPVL